MKQFLLAGAVTASVMLSVGGVQAEQITLGDSTSGNMGAAGLGGGNLTLSTSGITGNALYDASDIGTYTLGSMSLTAGPLTGGNFPINGSPTESFGFTANDGDTLTGTINYAGGLVKDDSPNPDLIGSLLITSVSGDDPFTSSFTVGATTPFDLTFANLSDGVYLSDLANCGDTSPCTSETATISAGEVPDTVPEPASILLLGAGLVFLGILRRPISYFGV